MSRLSTWIPHSIQRASRLWPRLSARCVSCAHDRTGDTRQAIVSAIGRTGRLITSAALILAISFASLSTVNDIAVEVPATGLAVGVILDAVIVRTLLVPAFAALLGRWNRWTPTPLARLLRIPAGALHEAAATPVVAP